MLQGVERYCIIRTNPQAYHSKEIPVRHSCWLWLQAVSRLALNIIGIIFEVTQIFNFS